MQKKTFNDYDAYVNDVDQFYSTIYQDLFFIANSADALMKMRDMKESDRLWNSDSYQASLKKVGANQVFYVLLYPENFGSGGALLSSSMAAV